MRPARNDSTRRRHPEVVSPRTRLLRYFLTFCIIFLPVSFGGVYAWAHFTVIAIVFFMLAIFPESFLEIRDLPTLTRLGVLILFCLLIFQTAMSSLMHSATATEFVKWTALLSLFLLLQKLSRSQIRKLLSIIVAVGIFQVLYGFFLGQEHILWREKTFHQGFLTGTYFNRNHLAGFLELSLGLHLGFLIRAFYRKEKLQCFLWAVSFLVVLGGFILTGSRMGLACFLGAAMLCTLFINRMALKVRLVFFLSFLFLGFICFFFSSQSLIFRIQEMSGGISTWDGGRFAAWTSALPMASDYALLGTGLGCFQWVFPQYQAAELTLFWRHLHQDYLQLVIELGVPGFCILMISLVCLWLRCISEFLHRRGPEALLIWGGIISITSILIHGFADFNFAIFANSFITIFILGSIWRLLRLSGNHAA